MLLERDAHESDTISLVRIVVWDLLGLSLVPFNLVSVDAVHTPHAETVIFASSKEP